MKFPENRNNLVGKEAVNAVLPLLPLEATSF